MFDLKDANLDITVESILNKVSELEIWSRYCSNFEEIDKSFCSDLYNDRNPGCRVYYNGRNKLVYKDHGNGDSFDCFGYIQAKYRCTFRESLRIIYNDFKLGSIRFDIIPQLVLNNAPEVLKMSSKPIVIEVISQAYNYTDHKVWGDYHIPLELLEEEEIISCKTVYLHKDNRTITYNSSSSNPIYAWKEYDIDLNFLGYKVYFPLANPRYKWLNSAGAEAIQGIKSIKRSGGTLGITKSRKDTLIYKLIGIEAIAPYNESGDLNINRIYELFDYYDLVFLNFDPDQAGINATNKIVEQWNLPHFYIPEGKDPAGYCKIHGLEQTKQMINNKIKQINEGKD